MEDTGTAINPEVDVGQIEGSFVFALGWWLQVKLSQSIRYNLNLLSNSDLASYVKCLAKVEWAMRSEVTLWKGCKNVANEATLYIVSGIGLLRLARLSRHRLA